jgi:DNA-binding NtrC family response regulator
MAILGLTNWGMRMANGNTDAAARTVLVVDDNRQICELLDEFLKSNDFDVLCAHDGTEALSLIDAHRVDLAIVDLLLPGPCSGDEVAAHASERNAKVITISGTLASDTRGRDLQHCHLQKPFRMHALATAIEKTFDFKCLGSMVRLQRSIDVLPCPALADAGRGFVAPPVK